MDSLPAHRPGFYSTLFFRLIAGDMLLSVFVFLLFTIFDRLKENNFLDPIEDRWGDRTTFETRGLASPTTDSFKFPSALPEDDSFKLKIADFSDTLFQHGLVVMVALGTPLHSPVVTGLCGLHLLILLAHYSLVLKGMRLAWIASVLCAGINVTILSLCVIEKVAQIPFRAAFNSLRSN